MKKFGEMAFPRFIIAGALNTGATYVLYLGLLYLMPYVWAYSLAYVVGIGLGYLLNAHWVFRQMPSVRTATAYPMTYGLNYLMRLLLLWVLVKLMEIPKELAPLAVTAISVPVMYLFTKSIFSGKAGS